eukprot:TCONS_00058452-protein
MMASFTDETPVKTSEENYTPNVKFLISDQRVNVELQYQQQQQQQQLYMQSYLHQLQTQQPSPTYAQIQQPTQYDEQLSPGMISSKNEIADSANSIARGNDDIFEDLEGDNGADDEEYDDEADDRMIERNRNLLMNSTEIGEGSEAVALPEISINKELLIESVRPYPILWQLSHPGYKDTTRKKIIWQSIKSHQFPGHGVESLKLQWKYLKDAWTRCNTKRSRHLLKSGSK